MGGRRDSAAMAAARPSRRHAAWELRWRLSRGPAAIGRACGIGFESRAADRLFRRPASRLQRDRHRGGSGPIEARRFAIYFRRLRESERRCLVAAVRDGAAARGAVHRGGESTIRCSPTSCKRPTRCCSPISESPAAGRLLAAWTLGRGVVASDLPYFREMTAADPDVARLVPPDDPAGPPPRDRKLSLHSGGSSRRRRPLTWPTRFGWNQAVVPFVQAIHSLRSTRRI